MTNSKFEPGLDFAHQLDTNDDLASFRKAFVIQDPNLIYLDGNSLGRLPCRSIDRINQVVEREWGEQLIRSWNANWYQSPQRTGDKIAQLLGAGPGQVVVSDSTSVNLYKLVLAALEMRPNRKRIISDSLNFPSDLYILEGCVHLMNERSGNKSHLSLEIIPSEDGISMDSPTLLKAIDDQTALVTLSHVAYKSGYLYDMVAITDKAHQVGALILWDLSHSAGVVPMELDRWGVDLAVGCTYKYLNGGPGAPAYLYVRQGLQELAHSPIWGWFGQHLPFAFEMEYQPAKGITRFLAGSPPILSLLSMEAAIELILEADIWKIRDKSKLMTSYLVYLVDNLLVPLGFTLASPRIADRRGSHVSIRHSHAYQINRVLIEEMKVIPDFREPEDIRLGLAPLYTSYREVWQAVDRIRRVVVEERYTRYPFKRLTVT
ncbi:MAG: kynureninase [Anaerolineales bacterium]|nr:kynureninase [Anaerolineales bacterium]